MSKIGILTFHYSNNYGGVLQTVSLYNTVKSLGYDVEIINFIPSNYKPKNIIGNLGIKRIFFSKFGILKISDLLKKVKVMNKNCDVIINKFNVYRENNMKLSRQVDEQSLETILNDYTAIVVGSDQVWNPSQRMSPIYFLNFKNKYLGKKISFAADSTIKEVSQKETKILKEALSEFDYISVRNDHSYDFVKTIIETEVKIVADPTLLSEFNDESGITEKKEEYILTYVLGEEIDGSHKKVIQKIKKEHGNIPVYSIKIPTMSFELSPFADKVYYDLNPDEWVTMFKNAKFIYTDSFHGVLFSLKLHKPFLAYYTERLRATRFIDLGKRYNIEKYIVQNTSEIDEKKSLEILPDFNSINKIINLQKDLSVDFLRNALSK